MNSNDNNNAQQHQQHQQQNEDELLAPCCGSDGDENDPDCILLAETLNELNTEEELNNGTNIDVDVDVDAVVCDLLNDSNHNDTNNTGTDMTMVPEQQQQQSDDKNGDTLMMTEQQQQQPQQIPFLSEMGSTTTTIPASFTTLTTTTPTTNLSASTSNEEYDLSFANYLDTHFQAMKPEYEKMIRMVGIERGSKVLDAGCGGGCFLPMLSELVGPTGHIEALDISPANVKAAQQLAHHMTTSSGSDSGNSQQHPSIHVQIGNVTQIPFANNTFDVVWCANVTQYLSDVELLQCLGEFRRILKPNGIVAVKELDLASNMICPTLHNPTHSWTLYQHTKHEMVNIKGCLRTPQLPELFRQADLAHINFAYVYGERRSPLSPVETEFIQSIFEYHALIAQAAGTRLPQEDQLLWRKLERFESSDHPMRSPHYYFREGHIVVVGRFDPHSFLPI